MSLISITFPIFIILLSRIFYGEKITVNNVAGIALVISDVLILVTRGKLSSLLSISFAPGDAIMLLAAFTFAVYSILLRRKPKAMNLWTLQASTFVVGVILLFPFFLWDRSTAPAVQINPGSFSLSSISGFWHFLSWGRAYASSTSTACCSSFRGFSWRIGESDEGVCFRASAGDAAMKNARRSMQNCQSKQRIEPRIRSILLNSILYIYLIRRICRIPFKRSLFSCRHARSYAPGIFRFIRKKTRLARG